MRLTGLDTAFLCLDRDVTPMNLGALATFRPADLGDPGRVSGLLAQRAQRLPVLRRRVEPSWIPLAAPTWVDEPGFCAKDHIRVHRFDGHAGLDGAAGLAAELMVLPLSRSRPLWEFHVIAGSGWDRFAVLFKMHHAFGDGLNALEIGAQVLDGFVRRAGSTHRGEHLGNGISPAAQPGVLARLWQVSGDVRDVMDGVVEQVTEVGTIAASVLRSARLPAPGSPLVIASSRHRALKVASLDLEQIRRIRRACGGTVHDVLLSVVTGALRRWLLTRGDQVDGLVLRAFVPVSRRARTRRQAGGNRLSGYLCNLPVGERDAGERLLTVRRTMECNRAAGASRGPGAVLLLADRLPAAVHRVAAPVAGQGAALLFDLMVTSIPVPSIPFTLGGAELAEVFPMAPLPAGQALVIGLSWHQSRAYVALHADRDALPDVQRLAEAIEPSAGELANLIE
ncbi:MAG TPA: wax ester/triacylglycerol synthase family O-acyltransferase [Pseudonocardiaceae bacterium]|nr:wax ester/triacylglycerol synthase family O-acyltransferase [Pseudonocardiaceae bacterium]